MARAEMEEVTGLGKPLTLYISDGRECHIPHRDQIALPTRSTSVFVFDDEGRFTILPALTITGTRATQSD
jgi:hypothetical protein